MEFGHIPLNHWYQPNAIDEQKAEASRNRLVEEGVIYGGSVSYRNMCRYNSGVRFYVPLLLSMRSFVEMCSSFSATR